MSRRRSFTVWKSWRSRLISSCAAACFGLAPWGPAQADPRADCAKSADLEQKIAACTALIKSGSGSDAVVYARAVAYTANFEFFLAKGDFDALISRHPNVAELYLDRAVAEAGEIEDDSDLVDSALADRNHAIALDASMAEKFQPVFAGVFVDRALRRLEAGNDGAVQGDLAEAKSLDPTIGTKLSGNVSNAYLARGLKRWMRGARKDAISDFETAHSWDHGSRDDLAILNESKMCVEGRHLLAARVGFDLDAGEIAAAFAVAEEIIKRWPRYAEGYVILAHVRYAQRDFKTALNDVDTALRLDPTESATWEFRGDILTLFDRFAEANNAYGEAGSRISADTTLGNNDDREAFRRDLSDRESDVKFRADINGAWRDYLRQIQSNDHAN